MTGKTADLLRQRGWTRLHELLREAAADADVKASDGPSQFLDLMIALAKPPRSINKRDLASAIEPLRPHFRQLEASKLAERGNAKYREAEQWIQREWLRDGPEYESKADFARFYEQKIVEKFGFESKVRERKIVEWLQGM